MKVLLGLLGYSCKIHRKRSKSSLNRLSFTETVENKFERSFSKEESTEENEKNNAEKIKATDADSEPLTGKAHVAHGENAELNENVQKSDHQVDNHEGSLVDQAEGERKGFLLFIHLSAYIEGAMSL